MLGCVMMEMAFGNDVFDKYATADAALDATFGSNGSDRSPRAAFGDLLRKMLAPKPKDRPSSPLVSQHAFFKLSREDFTTADDVSERSLSRSGLSSDSAIRVLEHSLPLPATPLGLARTPPSHSFMGEAKSGLHLSRFLTDFEDVTFLGKGGYGSVMKCKNKLDGRYYAVKRVRLDAKKEEYNQKFLREVTALSRLHHASVVRYYQAWIETGGAHHWIGNFVSDFRRFDR